MANLVLAKESERLIIGTYEIPGVAEQGENRGFLIEAVDQIFLDIQKALNVEVKIEFYPPARAKAKFKDKEIFGLVPSFKWQAPKDSLCSVKLATKVDLVFYMADIDPQKMMASNEYNIAIVRGYSYTPESLKKHKGKIKKVDSMKAAVKMLRLGRVDFILGDSATTTDELIQENIKDVRYSDKLSPNSAHARLCALDTPLGKRFIKAFNQGAEKEKVFERFWKFNRDRFEKFNSILRSTLRSSPTVP